MKMLLIMFTMLFMNEEELTPINVYNYCVEQGVEHPEIVTAQAIQETGWFKCTSCSLNRNNIFGFWYKKKYIEFTHWKESVNYYKRWQGRHYKGGDYYQFLNDRGYASDVNYNTRVENIVNKYSQKWCE